MRVDKKSDKEDVAAKDDVEVAKQNKERHLRYIENMRLWHSHAF